jgi:hypothetical protein
MGVVSRVDYKALGLSSQIKKLMNECREEVARIKTTPVLFAVMVGEQAEMGDESREMELLPTRRGQSARPSLACLETAWISPTGPLLISHVR